MFISSTGWKGCLNMFHFRTITISLNSIKTLSFLFDIHSTVIHHTLVFFCAFRNFIFNRSSIFFETLDWLTFSWFIWNIWDIILFEFIFRQQRQGLRQLRRHQKCYLRVSEKHLEASSKSMVMVFFPKRMSVFMLYFKLSFNSCDPKMCIFAISKVNIYELWSILKANL